MAKVISDEILKLKVVVNGDEAQKRVLDLELANKRLGITLKDLQQKQQVLSRQRKKDSDEYKQNERAINDLTKAIAKNKQEIDNEVKAMNIMSLTMEQLRKRANDLRFQLNNMNPNSPEYAKTSAQLAELNGRMTTLRTGANASAMSIQNLAGKFNHYSGIVTGALAALAGVALSIKGTIELNNKLAEAQTTVAKTTGMNNEEVKELMRTYSDFDTRTSKMDLLKISEVGGRLGVPKEEIAEFTKEVDKMYVALGDSFEGGVEQVANQMGKIKNLFRETKDLDIATAFNQIGSAMNELGANGAASESNIADFTLRIGALPDKLKPSIAETLALGAAFEESGVDSERAGTAYSSFVRMAAKESGKFAEVMNLTKKEVEDLINKDPMQFFLKFAEGAKGLDTVEMAKMLDYLKLNDQYVISILGAASENTDRFRKTINLSNEALQEATSLTEEFNKVNNNAAAIYDKVKKSIIGAFTSEVVSNTLIWWTQAIGKFIGAIEDGDGKVTAFKETLFFLIKMTVIATASIFSYNLAIGTYNGLMATAAQRVMALSVIEKSRSLVMGVLTAAQNLWNLSIGLGAKGLAFFTRTLGFQTVATNLQTAAQERLNVVTKANPLGLVLAVLTALVTAYILYKDQIIKTVDAQNKLNKVLDEGSANAAEELTNLDLLYKSATNAALGKDKQREAVEKLQKLYPSYFGNIDKEIIMNGKAATSYYALRDAIISSARADAAREELKKQQGDRIRRDAELERKINEETAKRNDIKSNPKDKNLRLDGGDGKSFSTVITGEDQLNASRQRLANLKKAKENNKKADDAADKMWVDAINANEARSAKLTKDRNSGAGIIPTTTSSYNTNVGGPATPKTKTTGKTDAQRAAEDAAKKWAAEKEAMLKNGETAKALAIQLEIDRQNAIADLETDWYTREYMQIKADGLAAVTELEKKLTTDAEFAKLDIIISKTKGAERAKFEELREQWLENNKTIEDLKLKSEEITLLKIQALNEKLFKENLKKEQDQLQEKIQANQNAVTQALAENGTVDQMKNFLRSLGYSEEALAAIKTWNEGKSAVEKYYQQQSLDEQIRFLRTKVEVLKALMVVDPTNITPEQLAILQNYTLEINKLLAAKNGLANSDQPAGPNFSSLSQFGAGNTDIFGLNPEQWEAMFTNTDDLATNINKVGAALQVAQNMFAQYSAFVQANEQKMLQKMEAASDRKQRKLKKELNEGYINQETYKKLTIANEMELEKKKAELALKAAKRERAMNIASAISGTAIAVVGALGNKPWTPFNYVLAGLVGAMGAIQLATIMSQPLPEVTGAEDGLYPVMRSQDKKVFNSRKKSLSSGMYNEPTLLVGEAGRNYPEMVIDGKTMKRLKPSTVQQLNTEVAQVRGFENGLYQENSTNASNDEIMIKMMSVLAENTQVMREIKETGITAIIAKTARNGKEVDEMRQEYLDLKNKNKH